MKEYRENFKPYFNLEMLHYITYGQNKFYRLRGNKGSENIQELRRDSINIKETNQEDTSS